MNTPEGILCTKTNEWVLEEQDCVLVGLTDWVIDKMEDVVVVELPEIGAEFEKDEAFATVESVREAREIYLPVGGKVVKVNEKLINSPELLNEDAWENWLVKIEPFNFIEDSQGLLEYDDYIEEVN